MRWHRRSRRERGATLVECTFTLLPTLAMICGFIDFGLVLYRWNTLQNAVREGARYAITFQQLTQNGTRLGQTQSIQNVVEKYALGIVKATDTPQHIFVCYSTTTAPGTCIPSGGNQPGNLVEVTVKNISFAWLAPLSGSYSRMVAPFFRDTTPFSFSVSAADILGGLPAGSTGVAE